MAEPHKHLFLLVSIISRLDFKAVKAKSDAV